MESKKIIIAITGASGMIYAKVLLDKLKKLTGQIHEISLVFSDNAREIWSNELPDIDYQEYEAKIYENTDFSAPFASGSALYNLMIVCPCSMGILGRMAQGISNDLITRAADVMLKERKKLILVPRETPFNLIHLENMKKITLAGGIICPAIPSFYSKPKTLEALVSTVVDRILDLSGFRIDTYRYNT